MIKQGDRVKFISDTAVGIVKSINGSMANVLIEDGFEVPAMLTDLVVVEADQEAEAIRKMGVSDGKPINSGIKQPKTAENHGDKKTKIQSKSSANQYGRISLVDEFEDEEIIDLPSIRANYLKTTAAANNAEVKKEAQRVAAIPSPTEITDYDIKLCIVPENSVKPDESSIYKIYLVNDSSYEALYNISKWSTGNYVTTISSGTLNDDSKKEISILKKEQLSAGIKFLVNIILFKPLSFVPQPVESFTLEISPMKFVRRGSYVENNFFDEPSMIFTIASSDERQQEQPQIIDTEKVIAKAIKEKEDKKQVAPRKNNEPEVIDLHAEEILDNTDGMSAGEIITAQLARFEIAMDLAIGNNRNDRIVFIHGIGSGKLKFEMKKLLASKYPRIKYQDASFQEYGYGAIMVYFKSK